MKIYFVFTALLSIFVFSCSTQTENAQQPVGTDTNYKAKTPAPAATDILRSGNYSIAFIDSNWHVVLNYKSKDFDLGKMANSMGYAPNANLDTSGKTDMITVTQSITTYGKDQYFITVFNFDRENGIVKQVCAFNKIHGSDDAQSPEHTYYELSANADKKQVVLEEYFPYKSDDGKYKTQKQTCNW